jgi:phenylpyruvate tautomerase PptA (4-oxalocrotonate tautomerase family)
MPHAKVYATAGRTSEQKVALLEAIHQGLVDGLGIPDWDRQVRLVELAADEVLLPEQHDAASYVLVEVFGFPRSIEVKRDLYAALVKHLAGVGTVATDTKINYYDIPADAWGIDGEPAPDVMARGDTGWTAKY